MSDMPSVEAPKYQPETERPLAIEDYLKSADATTISRLKNLVPERARHALRLSTQKTALTVSALAMMISSGCGNMVNPDVQNNPEPTPASAFVSPLIPSDHHQISIPSSEAISTNTQEQKPPIPETPSYLESKIIDSMETYGAKNPLNKFWLKEIYKKLNSVEQEMKDDTYYGTFFVSEELYRSFRTNIKDDTLQKFLKRHEAVFNEKVHMQPYPDTNKLVIRRLIVVERGVSIPEGYIFDFLNRYLEDSDGTWKLEGKYDLVHPLEYPAYYDGYDGIDYGLLHELGHAVFHLPDQYSLDFKPDTQLPKELENSTPMQWRTYFGSRREDIGNNLMSTVQYQNSLTPIGLYTNLQLLRRIERNEVHNQKKTREENCWCFPYEVPKATTFSFGEDYANATVEIFRSTEVDANKRPSAFKRKKKLELIGNYVNSENGNLTLTKDKLFLSPDSKENLIEAEVSTLFLKITTKDGKSYFRWMDIRDFNIPYWQGNKEHVTMSFDLASEKDDPKEFDWKIKYSK